MEFCQVFEAKMRSVGVKVLMREPTDDGVRYRLRYDDHARRAHAEMQLPVELEGLNGARAAAIEEYVVNKLYSAADRAFGEPH